MTRPLGSPLTAGELILVRGPFDPKGNFYCLARVAETGLRGEVTRYRLPDGVAIRPLATDPIYPRTPDADQREALETLWRRGKAHEWFAKSESDLRDHIAMTLEAARG